MRISMILPLAGALGLVVASAERQARPAPVGTRLEAISWESAEPRLTAGSVVVVPLGAGSLEHGPHLPLGAEQRLAEYLAGRMLDTLDVIVAPTLSYHHYPGFDEYAGSTSLSLATARELTTDVARSLARYGPRRFYVLNTSSATMPALSEAARVLEREGMLLRYTNPRARLDANIRTMRPRQPFGSHADEVETSMLLHVDASLVDMARAPRDLGAQSIPFVLTRRPGGHGTYSPSGVWGDATLATTEKGRILVDTLLAAIRNDIEDLRRTALPVSGARGSSAARIPTRSAPMPQRPGECTAGDDRTIRGLGPAFSFAWANQDAIALSGLWTAEGDMVHPDGFVERSAQTIRENRTALFMRPEYRGSRHGLYIGQIRCLTYDVAVADARWDLRGVSAAKGVPLPPMEGLSTLVLKRRDGGWGIEAYRYTIKETQATRQPTVLNRPGFPGGL